MFIILKKFIEKLIRDDNLNYLINNYSDIDIIKISKNNKDYFITVLISKLFKFVVLKPKYDLKKNKIHLKETKNKETENKETENKETENKETENKETENKETENKETENKETENKETENKETENKETKNKETENKETENKETENTKKNININCNNEINLKNKYLLKLYKKCVVKCHPDKCNDKFNNDLFLLLQYSIENNELYLIVLIAKYLNIDFKINKEVELLLNYYINWLDMQINNLNSIINS